MFGTGPLSPDSAALLGREGLEPTVSAAELHRGLTQLPSRFAQTLIFHCLESRPPQECAALYGIDLPQWEILFWEAARGLARETAPLSDFQRRALAAQLQSELTHPVPNPMRASVAAAALRVRREEVHRLLIEAERVAAESPARARDGWLRRLAVGVIIVVSILVWLRERT